MTGSMSTKYRQPEGPRKRHTTQTADMHLILPKLNDFPLRNWFIDHRRRKMPSFTPFSDLAILLFLIPP